MLRGIKEISSEQFHNASQKLDSMKQRGILEFLPLVNVGNEAWVERTLLILLTI